MEIRLRSGRDQDFDLLWGMDQRCFPPGIAYSRRELASYLAFRGSFTLVAETVENLPRPVGFLVAMVQSHDIGHVITIDVLPEVQRAGVGSRLMREAEARLTAAKCRRVTLETAVDNRAALLFYKRHGYTLVKTMPRYYSNGVDALVLEKDLHSAAQAS